MYKLYMTFYQYLCGLRVTRFPNHVILSRPVIMKYIVQETRWSSIGPYLEFRMSGSNQFFEAFSSKKLTLPNSYAVKEK